MAWELTTAQITLGLVLAGAAVWALYVIISMALWARAADRRVDGHYPFREPPPHVPPSERNNWK